MLADVDLLVDFNRSRKTCWNFKSLADLLEERLQRRVELVATEALSPYIGPHILREAEDVLQLPTIWSCSPVNTALQGIAGPAWFHSSDLGEGCHP